jgi:hypothetical protein
MAVRRARQRPALDDDQRYLDKRSAYRPTCIPARKGPCFTTPTRCGSSRCGVSATLSADQPDLRVELQILAGRHVCFTHRVFANGLAVSRTAARRTRGRSPDRPAGAAAGQCFRRGGIRSGIDASGQMAAGAPCFWPDAGSPVAGYRQADTRSVGWVTDGRLPGQPSWQVAVPDRRGPGSGQDREEGRQALLEQRIA